MISHGVEISIAGGGGEMVRVLSLLVGTKRLISASSHNPNPGDSSPRAT